MEQNPERSEEPYIADRLSTSNSDLRALLRASKLCVCCGAGGVGKTTTSAALALSGARLGLRVLALTIDPSKRLAQALGVARNTPHPVLLDRARLTALGVPDEGSLSAWLLDPQLVSDAVVNREAGKEAEALKRNLIYREISGMVAGMQEYTAVEALHTFLQDDAYDLIILDTPPARHALRFIDSPQRIASFLDKKIFQLFVPSQAGLLGRVASRVIDEVLDRAFGEEPRRELKQFFELFSRLLDHLNSNQAEMSEMFRSEDVQFFMVTTARLDAVDEAERFAAETQARGLHLGGFFLNRCAPHESIAGDHHLDGSEERHTSEVAQTETLQIEMLRAQLRSSLTETQERSESSEAETNDAELSELCELLDGHVQHQVSADRLRRDTAQSLSMYGSLYRLRELTADASSLEGISALADQLMGDHLG